MRTFVTCFCEIWSGRPFGFVPNFSGLVVSLPRLNRIAHRISPDCDPLMNPSSSSSALPPAPSLETAIPVGTSEADGSAGNAGSPLADVREKASMGILLAISASHMFNDILQALLVALYPLLKATYQLTYTQIGYITLTFQLTASLLQPIVGYTTDRRPRPFSLSVGMGATLIGLLMLSRADSFPAILVAASLVGLGSSVFHPEASRIARMASGGKHGFAQSLFQVGGNFGSALGPLLAALIVTPRGQPAIAWFALLAAFTVVLLARVGFWYRAKLEHLRRTRQTLTHRGHTLPARTVALAIVVLVVLVISKYFYLVSLTNYYMFYLMKRFALSEINAQYCLFAFLTAVAAGTFAGGPIGDRFGRKVVIWFSILGVAPFSLLMPYVNLEWTIILSCVIGLILASAFSAILVFAQELMPGRVGMVAGLFFGFAFGVSGIASALLGMLADQKGIEFVFYVCSFLPLFGLVTYFLPNLKQISD
jgi:FSR family fosmidomycin resistance protein-like MFS transporter